MSILNMKYTKILSEFKIEWEAFQELKKEDAPECSTINDRNNDQKVIKWMSPF